MREAGTTVLLVTTPQAPVYSLALLGLPANRGHVVELPSG